MQAIKLRESLKAWTKDLDKTKTPTETIDFATQRLAECGLDILAEAKRIDTGRLNIPVFVSMCGKDALKIMPTRKQMGKGSSVAQANASAIMELMERYSFFAFQEHCQEYFIGTWSEALAKFKGDLLPLSDMCRSVNDPSSSEEAQKMLDTRKWHFYPATRLIDSQIVWLPLDWFRLLGEFNGTSAGNTPEESILQGISELIERHVCAKIAQKQSLQPTIDPASIEDSTLQELLAAFKRENIQIILKDFSLSMPLPTVGALAYDEKTFPEHSEIVFTAGTASSPAKAAIRAVTEVAQLAGDFCTNACYEASGLPKFHNLDEINWLLQGKTIALNRLPSVLDQDIAQEVRNVIKRLAPLNVYSVDLTHPKLKIPAHYNIVPGLDFRERDHNQCLGLFIGRALVENDPPEVANKGLEILSQTCPGAHYLPFFQGLLALRLGDTQKAQMCFTAALHIQPDTEARAMVHFYTGYTYTLINEWQKALPNLKEAFSLCPEMKEYASHLGIAFFKTADYNAAKTCFAQALALDKGSAMDWANLGMTHSRMANIPKAKECLQRAMELDPSLEFAHKELMKLTKK